jgi:hypothetical protein
MVGFKKNSKSVGTESLGEKKCTLNNKLLGRKISDSRFNRRLDYQYLLPNWAEQNDKEFIINNDGSRLNIGAFPSPHLARS